MMSCSPIYIIIVFVKPSKMRTYINKIAKTAYSAATIRTGMISVFDPFCVEDKPSRTAELLFCIGGIYADS